MTSSTKKTPLPVQYKETSIVTCDGCGLEVGVVGPGSTLGWLVQKATKEDGRGGIGFEDEMDFCPDCRPKVKRAQKQEADAIRAEKLAAAAEISGVS